MALESAQQFVEKMRDDLSFRKSIKGTLDTNALKKLLKKSRFEFTKRELMLAMASCMEEMEKEA